MKINLQLNTKRTQHGSNTKCNMNLKELKEALDISQNDLEETARNFYLESNLFHEDMAPDANQPAIQRVQTYREIEIMVDR
ncbi:hypothetical protein CEXT_507601 [Caerostris extrusa]|uniref:Uncharacterized protein n=1 Tax=Caerostris extrusa TaxID=172846 RepID=A0AAV4P6F4_CAEEX|nr:hypothetical protein CEXT_507601 [Caerostris extrusa]